MHYSNVIYTWIYNLHSFVGSHDLYTSWGKTNPPEIKFDVILNFKIRKPAILIPQDPVNIYSDQLMALLVVYTKIVGVNFYEV